MSTHKVRKRLEEIRQALNEGGAPVPAALDFEKILKVIRIVAVYLERWSKDAASDNDLSVDELYQTIAEHVNSDGVKKMLKAKKEAVIKLAEFESALDDIDEGLAELFAEFEDDED